MQTRDALRYFIPLALGLTALTAVVYVNDQQLLREGANEPQLAMAQDLANALGASPGATTTDAMVQIELSLSPYVVVYDSYGNPVGGTGLLEGVLPAIPSGIFDVIRGKDSPDLLTWQPEAGVREAIAVVPVNGGAGGFVMGGRSLEYVEHEESALTRRTAFGWLIVMLAALLGSYIAVRLRKR